MTKIDAMNRNVGSGAFARSSRLRCLVVSPVIPALDGSGIAMRIGRQIRALATFLDITLTVVVDDATEAEVIARVPADLRNACSTVLVISARSRFERYFRRLTGFSARIFEACWPVPRSFTRVQPGIALLASRLANDHFDIVHCFRLATARFPKAFRRHGGSYSDATLDIDDYESHAKFRAVKSIPMALGVQYFLLRSLEAVKWMILESFLIPRFDRVYICSELDRALLRTRFIQSNFFVVPNVVSTPVRAPHGISGRPFTFFFVGTLDYPPNVDGISYFLRTVLPILHRIASVPFRVRVIGRDPERRLIQLAEFQGVEVFANPTSVETFYDEGNVAIVPLRTGGGTRIKILEAFSYAIPVVSTTIGAEGLDVTPERNILIADDPEEFARQCARLLADDALCRKIGEAGHRLFRERYTDDALVTALRSTNLSAVSKTEPGTILRNTNE